MLIFSIIGAFGCDFHPKSSFVLNHYQTMARSISCNTSISSSDKNSNGNASWHSLPKEPKSDLRDHLNHNQGGCPTSVPLVSIPIYPTLDIQSRVATIFLNDLVVMNKNLVLLIQANHTMGHRTRRIGWLEWVNKYFHEGKLSLPKVDLEGRTR